MCESLPEILQLVNRQALYGRSTSIVVYTRATCLRTKIQSSDLKLGIQSCMFQELSSSNRRAGNSLRHNNTEIRDGNL
jgi:hypothetical protein